MTDIHHLAKNITCHAWNRDKTKLALCPNNNEVWMFSYNGKEWTKDQVLREHDQLVTGIDWAPKTNRFVTCSEDRNAYVWTFTDGAWKPTLVILRINRAATAVQWSPNEDKFAVASGAKVVSVCYFEEENDWWVSKHIKKHKSTVLSVDWHPNNLLLLTGSSDYKARIFSAFVKEVEKKPKESVLGFGPKIPFGELLMELDASHGWVHCARWSPSGTKVAFVGHDSSITFADVSTKTPQQTKLKHGGLPFQTLIWASENKVVAAGHEYEPFVFSDAGGWKSEGKLDKGGAKPAAPAGGPKPGGMRNAMAMFQNRVDRGEDERKGTKISSKHQNCISHVSIYKGAPGSVSSISTTGVDGNICFWTL